VRGTKDRHVLRGLIALPVLGALGLLLFWGLSGLPPFGNFHGEYGHLISTVTLPQRHTSNAVTAVVFDYRGFDTLGEEFILFGAVVGVVLLLREEGGRGGRDEVRSDQLRLVGAVMVAAILVIGLWLVSFGFVTPGGGFQGGVVVAAAILLVYLTQGHRPWRKITKEHALDPFEGLGVGSYVALGLATAIAGAPFLHNFLGPGKAGTLVSGGSMPFLNWATAIEVAAANLVLYTEFLQHYLEPLGSKESP
jgi:multicomponent Na+:H+ antiporter subunit B